MLFQRLDERDFGHQKEVNKRKQLLLEGKVRKCYFSLQCLVERFEPLPETLVLMAHVAI